MEKLSPEAFYSKNIGLIHQVSKKGYGRLQSVGSSMQYEDMMQELSIVFLKAYELYQPDRGSKFSTYFTLAAYHKINRIIDEISVERIEFGTKSVEELDTYAEDNETSIAETIADTRQTPEEAVVAKLNAIEITNKLSPLSTLIVDWLVSPPDFLFEELNKVEAHAEHARELGYRKRCKAKIDVAYVCSMIRLISDVSESEVRNARDELKFLVDRECRYGC